MLTDLHLDAKPFMYARKGFGYSAGLGGDDENHMEPAEGNHDFVEEKKKSFKKVFDMATSRVQATIDRKLGHSLNKHALYAHRGMADSANALLDPVVGAIHDAHNRRGGRYRNYQVVVTGHSLGAGTGCLLAMLIAAHTSLPVKTFAFAPPPVLSRDTYAVDKAQHMSDNGSDDLPHGTLHSNCVIHSFIHHNDVVPRASHFELLNMLAAIASVDALPWTPTDRSLLLLRGKLTQEEAQLMQEHLDNADNYHQENEGVELCVPGHVHWLQPIYTDRNGSPSNSSNKGSSQKEKCSPTTSGARRYRVSQLEDSRELFNGYLFTGDSMMVDHPVIGYMEAMLNIDSSNKVE